MTTKKTQKLVFSGVCLALCLLLPFLTGQIQAIGNKISPMHIPVFLCGFLCGGLPGAAVGFVAPLMRSVMFGMPPMLPVGLAMSFELAGYGAVSGFLYRRSKQNTASTYAVLVAAMLAGRAVWGVASSIIYTAMGRQFPFQMFVAGAFINAVPGIILHLVIIPPIVLALKKAGLFANN